MAHAKTAQFTLSVTVEINTEQLEHTYRTYYEHPKQGETPAEIAADLRKQGGHALALADLVDRGAGEKAEAEIRALAEVLKEVEYPESVSSDENNAPYIIERARRLAARGVKVGK